MTRNTRIISGGLMAAVLLSGTAACSSYNDARGKGDAPVAGRHGDDTPKYVTNNPDGFGNIVTGCVYGAKGWRYFATTKSDKTPANIVVRADKTC